MKNLVASILDRLKNASRKEGRAYNLIIEDYATARLIARLAASSHKDRFILKGAQLFKLWSDVPHRPTRDADFLSFGTSSPEDLNSVFQEICAIDTDPPDALLWTVDSAAQIREDNLYGESGSSSLPHWERCASQPKSTSASATPSPQMPERQTGPCRLISRRSRSKSIAPKPRSPRNCMRL